MIFFDGPKEPKSRCRWRTKNILERIGPTPLLIEVYGQSVYTQKSLYRYNGYIHIYTDDDDDYDYDYEHDQKRLVWT